MTLQAAIAGVFDAALARRSEPWARTAQHRFQFERIWAELGLPDDPALKRRTFAQLQPQFVIQDARRDLSLALAADDQRRRLNAARARGRRQGRALALREHDRALTAALGERIAAVQSRELERKRRLTSQGPVRIF